MLSQTIILTLLALQASSAPYPQGVTESIAPEGQPKEGCQKSYDGKFGITIMNSTSSSSTTQQTDGQPNASGAQQIADGQVQTGTDAKQIPDGQIQAPVNQIQDGQIQNQKAPVNQIGDGQVQNQMAPVNQIQDGQIQNQKAPVTQIQDGQPQSQGATQLGDGQVNNPVNQIGDGQPQQQADAVTQIGDGQTQTGTGATQMGDGQVNNGGSGTSGGSGGSSGGSGGLTGCQKPDSLQLTLQDGVLKDSQGRTGYIASNQQYQFDSPPQTGAIYTSGFSVCNGALALGDKDTWFQCLSGDFYNLYYERPENRQDCEEVKMMVLNLKEC